MHYIHKILLLFFLFLSGCDDKKATNEPDITLLSTTKEQVIATPLKEGMRIDKSRGKMVVLDFFTTSCTPCRELVPHMTHIQATYGADVDVYGVLMEGRSNAVLEAFMREHKGDYTVLNSPNNLLLANAVGGVMSVPLVILFDKEGGYIQHYMGYEAAQLLEQDIQKALSR